MKILLYKSEEEKIEYYEDFTFRNVGWHDQADYSEWKIHDGTLWWKHDGADEFQTAVDGGMLEAKERRIARILRKLLDDIAEKHLLED